MKRLLLATTALAFVSPSFAADMPIKAPAAPPPHHSWSGCYLGGNMGVGWGRARLTDPTSAPIAFGAGNGYFAPTGSSVGITSTGGLAGGQIGCDEQFANNWVIGLAGDFSWANISNEVADPFFAGKAAGTLMQLKDNAEWLASATARLGYAWDRVLLYAKGGAAWSRNRYTIENVGFWGTPGTPFPGFCGTTGGGGVTSVFTCNPTGASTLSGWTVGAGLEYAITDNWSAGIEYNHYGFGTKTVSLVASSFIGGVVGGPPTVSPAVAVPIRQDIDTVKVTVNYRFNTFGH